MNASSPTPAPRGGRPGPRRSTGLRERKRARVRQELMDAAAALFAERGFDQVTVDEIADAADVAPRTFYRYFPVKEDVATADLQETSALLLEELAARPPEEPPLVALREAIRLPVARVLEQPRLCAAMRMLGTSPSLLAHEMAMRARTSEAVTRVLAERMGVDDEADVRPRVIAACFMASIGVAFHGWLEDGARDDLSPRVDEVMALLRRGLEPAA
jgi:AcrR family transcriptional regulator